MDDTRYTIYPVQRHYVAYVRRHLIGHIVCEGNKQDCQTALDAVRKAVAVNPHLTLDEQIKIAGIVLPV